MTLEELIAAGGLQYAEELTAKGWGPTAIIDAILIRYPDATRFEAIDVQAASASAYLLAGDLERQGNLSTGQIANVPTDPTLQGGSFESTILIIWENPEDGRQTRVTRRVIFDHIPSMADIESAGNDVMQGYAEEYGWDPEGVEVETTVLSIYGGA